MTLRNKQFKSSRLSKKRKPQIGSPGADRLSQVPLAEVKDDLSRYLRMAEAQEIVITRHGRPAGLLIGFRDEDEWFEYRLEHDPEFLRRIARARADLRAGRGIRLEDIPED